MASPPMSAQAGTLGKSAVLERLPSGFFQWVERRSTGGGSTSTTTGASAGVARLGGTVGGAAGIEMVMDGSGTVGRFTGDEAGASWASG